LEGVRAGPVGLCGLLTPLRGDGFAYGVSTLPNVPFASALPLWPRTLEFIVVIGGLCSRDEIEPLVGVSLELASGAS
jgi:hypothetical protein